VSNEAAPGSLRNALLLLSGVFVGALATAGLALLVLELRDDGRVAEALAAPNFVEEARAAGVDHVYDGEFQYFVGGGVAAFDCDDDGRSDLFFAGGSRPAGLFRNESPVGGELRFSALHDPVTDMTGVTGAYPLDVDSDGLTDLAVLRVGENSMLRGLGDCRFEPANELWGVDGGMEWTASFSATWEGEEELPTLAFGNYLALTEEGERGEGCADHSLFRPQGDRYGDEIGLSPGWCTLSILFSDWSRTGQRDLRMTNDRHYYTDGEEQLWKVIGGEVPSLYGRDDGWAKTKIWGMGIASHDLDGDGLPEVFLTSQGDNKLQTLSADTDGPSYEDIALSSGATAHRPFIGDTTMPSTAWHAEFDDVNNDGFMDLFVTKGNVDAMPEFAMNDPNNLLLGQPDGTFVEGAEDAGLADLARSRGGVVVDLNLDGLLDVVVVDRRENVKVWRNLGHGGTGGTEPMGNWLAVDIEQPGPNSDAIGSWIEVRFDSTTIRREVTVGGGHAGGELGWTHFGLGEATEAEVRVLWPDGDAGPWLTVETNQFAILARDTTAPAPWTPLSD
jgi:hypothetical protein